jgi:uncharacterized protein (TIGR03118 family)
MPGKEVLAMDRVRGQKISSWIRGPAVALTLLLGAALLSGPLAASASGAGGGFHRANLVSDVPGKARVTDPDLVNAWGLALGPATPAWVADNGSDVSTIYQGGGRHQPVAKVPLTVSIPGGAPTGAVFNRTSHFKVHSNGAKGPALFIFASESGRISGWNPGVPAGSTTSTQAISVVHRKNAIFKGLAIASNDQRALLYATDFHNGRVDVFNRHFRQVDLGAGAFMDPQIPSGYAPFGIKKLGDRLFVTYAKQDANREDDTSGPGNGFVDEYSFQGDLIKRLASHGTLNSPWGLALGRNSFGRFDGALLVGNFGDGHISAFDPATGRFLGRLHNAAGRLMTIDGLWALRYGNGVAGSYQRLLFTAGPADEGHGLFGSIRAAG